MHSRRSAVQIPAPRIKPAFTSLVPFVSTHSVTSAMMERRLICPARPLSPPSLPPPLFSLGTVLSKSWRSLLSAESVGLKAAVSCPPFPTIGLPVTLWAPALSPSATKLLRMCAAVHTKHVIPNHLAPTSAAAEHCGNLPPI